VPYLINRKRVTEQQCFKIVVDWLDKCSELSSLDFVMSYKVKEAIKNVAGFGPVHPDKLKQERPGLYELLMKFRMF
jgi:hypothetical protein